MSIDLLRAEGFRCLDSMELDPGPEINLIHGRNGSGKTSVLEAAFVLGRGRSFRSGELRALIAENQRVFTVFGEVNGQGAHKLGIQVGRGRTEAHLNGAACSVADLVNVLPVQAIDPAVHELVQGGPERRRRFLDWGVFHVEPAFLPAWRRYRKALRQRNSLLRQRTQGTALEPWDRQLAEAAEVIDGCRSRFMEAFRAPFRQVAEDLLSETPGCRYQRGWPAEGDLLQTLVDTRERDFSSQSTQMGPHRADLKVELAQARARNRVSRGQQKLLGAAMILAQLEVIREKEGIVAALLVDDPAAELDKQHVARLMSRIQDYPGQRFIAALEPEALALTGQVRRFHVEQGTVTREH